MICVAGTTRRDVLRAFSALALSQLPMMASSHSWVPYRLLLGTGGGEGSRGIYVADWKASTGELGPITLVAEVKNPSFLAIRRRGAEQFVYAVSEASGDEAKVSAYRVAAGGSGLVLLNAVAAGGDSPTHIALSPEGNAVFCANYGGGSVSSYRVNGNGSLSECVSHFQFSGSGPDASRQEKPHTHSVNPSPDGGWLLVNDLGVDRIFIYKVNSSTAELTPAGVPFWSAKPGSGPRHLAFHPNGKWAYSVNELTSTVDIIDWNSREGTLTLKGSVSTLKEGFPPGTAFAGEILCSPDGRDVYVGNRVADDSIAVFGVDQRTGILALKQLAPNPGKNPRHVALDPSGRWLVLCDVGTGAICILERNRHDGTLRDTGHSYDLPSAEFAGFL